MAKRTKKNSKSARSLLKLEALEQRQLLAGGFTDAQGYSPEAWQNIVASNGNVYDQVLMKGSSITVNADAGQVTRVSFLDVDGDIVQAEFSGHGTLTISLDQFSGPAAAEKYTQPSVEYVKGNATFTIQGSDVDTYFTVFTVGVGTAHNGENNPIFSDPAKEGGNHWADVQRLTVVADPANPNGSIMGGIKAGNAVFSGTSGVVGITAANVAIQDFVRVGDIDAKGSATPALVFGTNSQFAAVDITGGDLVQTNAKLISNTGSYQYTVNAVANVDSSGAAVTAKTISSGLFSGSDPLTAINRNFTLSTGVDTMTGGSGNDSFTADNTSSANFSAADTLNGGEGTDSLTIFGTTGGTAGILSNIENVTLDSMGAGTTWNLASATGMQTLMNSRAVGASTVAVPAGVKVTLASNAADTLQTVTFNGNDTAADLTLNTVSAATTGVTVNGAKIATLNLTTQAAASSVGTLTTPNATTTLNVAGDQNLTITNALNDKVTKVDGTNFTGKLSVVAGNPNDDGTSAVDLTLIGGTKDDTLSIVNVAAGTETSVSGGVGNDTIKVTSAQINDKTDVLDGGEGSDTLSVDFGDALAGVTNPGQDLSANIKNIESITLVSSAGNANTPTWAEGTIKSGVKSFTINGDNGDSFVLTGLAADTNVKVSSNQTGVSVNGTGAVTATLDGTTIGTLTTNAYETVNVVSNKDSGGNTNTVTTGTMGGVKTLNLSGAGDLTITAGTLNSGATFDATNYSGKIDATFASSVKSYVGGSGEDKLTLLTGDLKQGNTFAGGAGDKDSLTVTATSAQDMGLVAVTGFETVNITAADDAANDTVTADFRNSTGIGTLNVASGAGETDNFTLNRLDGAATLKFGSNVGNVVTTVQTGTAQKIAFGGNYTVGALVLDSGTTSLTITSDNGATDNEAGGVITALSGTSLTSITLDGKDQTKLPTLGATVTSVNASASKGALTVTASGTATTIVGSQANDSITGGAGKDVLEGGKGDDTLAGGGDADQYVFANSGANNGTDTITLVAGAAGDKLQFKNFLSGGSVDQNGGGGTAIAAYSTGGASDVDITNKVVLLADGAGVNTGVDTSAEIAALIQGSGNVFSLGSGGKAIIIAGDSTGANATSFVYFIDDTLDGNAGTVSATDVVKVAVTNANFDLDTITTGNVIFA